MPPPMRLGVSWAFRADFAACAAAASEIDATMLGMVAGGGSIEAEAIDADAATLGAGAGAGDSMMAAGARSVIVRVGVLAVIVLGADVISAGISDVR